MIFVSSFPFFIPLNFTWNVTCNPVRRRSTNAEFTNVLPSKQMLRFLNYKRRLFVI